MSPLRAFNNHDHLKPPHEDNPADSRIEDYRSRPDVTRELPDEPDNYQMSPALVFMSLGRVVISPGGVGLHIPRRGGLHLPRKGKSSYPSEGSSLRLTHPLTQCVHMWARPLRARPSSSLSCPMSRPNNRSDMSSNIRRPRPRDRPAKGAPLVFISWSISYKDRAPRSPPKRTRPPPTP